MTTSERGPGGNLSDRIAFVVLAGGAALRIAQFAATPALFLDEIALVRNVRDLPLVPLLRGPLALGQSAAPGFLALEKGVVGLLGTGGRAVRLVPFLLSLLALALFWPLARRLLDRTSALFALVLFAAAAPLIESAGFAKQYAGDVFASVLLLDLALGARRPDRSRRVALLAGLAGVPAVLLSQPAVLVVAALALADGARLARTQASRGPALRDFLAVYGPWGGAAALVVAGSAAAGRGASGEYLRRFWSLGFPPATLPEAVRTLWPLNQLRALVGIGTRAGFGYALPTLFLAAAAAGVLLLTRKSLDGILVAAPIFATFLAACVRLYPFSDRLILFLFPALALSAGASVDWLVGRVAPWGRGAGGALGLLLVGQALLVPVRTPPPYTLDDVGPALRRLSLERRPGDAIWVLYAAGPAVDFHAGDFGLRPEEFARGGCHRGAPRDYLRELDAFRGRNRVWVLLAHTSRALREREDVLGYLDVVGIRRTMLETPSRRPAGAAPGVTLALYDLSDPGRLARANADAYPVEGPTDPGPRMRCAEGPLAEIGSAMRNGPVPLIPR